MLTEAIRKGSPLPEQHLTIPESVPSLAEITPRVKSSAAKQRSASV
jgi:hypothetical protein